VTAANTDPQRVLTEEIIADARRQAERLFARTRREAEDAVRKARDEIAKDREQRLAAARAEAERRRLLILATVPVEVGRMRATRVEKVLESIHEAACDRLRRREGFDYRQTVAALAADAVGRVQGDAFVLELAEADRAALGDGLAEEVRRLVGRDGVRMTVAQAPGPVGGGVIVRDAAGRRVWDNRLEARLERFWPMLRREIAARTALAPAAAGPKPDVLRKES